MNILSSALATIIVATAPASTSMDIEKEDAYKSEVKLEASATQTTKTTQEVVEDIAREKILARWRKKQKGKWNNLPKGSFTINASAYTASADECGKSDGITASGVSVQEKRTLACPPEYPFGAKIAIGDLGIYTCEDRGGAIKGNHFDIYMKTKAEAFAFGRRNILASVVE